MLAVIPFILSPVGRWLGMAAIAVAVYAFAFFSGYEMRAKSDHSASLQATVVELQREAKASAEIAERASQAEQAAERYASDNQEKVDAYEASLKKRPACALSRSDVKRLRGIAGGH